ncbi:MAG: hypothetical protein M1819_004776 [Sarea resinae]|nr:MAG: hypothetical protein M1819_004776 [Sarea resinae]
MSSQRQAEDAYEEQNDATGGDVPSGSVQDDSYASRTGQSHIPVQKDDAPLDDPYQPKFSNSDEQLQADDADAIDSSNIIGSKTRGAKPRTGGYGEPGDEEGLPGPEDGTSSGRQ